MLTLSDGLLIGATFLGPIFAVQVQKFIERATEKKRNRLLLFRTLMATRAVRAASNDHVQALNMIDLSFDGKNKKEKDVKEAWNIYRDFLNEHLPDGTSEDIAKIHNEKGIDFFVALLQAMGRSVGYDFDQVKLKKGAYYPQIHRDDNKTNRIIRDGFAKIVSGNAPIKIEPLLSEEAIKKQNDLQEKLLKVLSGESALKIKS